LRIARGQGEGNAAHGPGARGQAAPELDPTVSAVGGLVDAVAAGGVGVAEVVADGGVDGAGVVGVDHHGGVGVVLVDGGRRVDPGLAAIVRPVDAGTPGEGPAVVREVVDRGVGGVGVGRIDRDLRDGKAVEDGGPRQRPGGAAVGGD